MIELKNCPFCGGEPRTSVLPYDGTIKFNIICTKCSCTQNLTINAAFIHFNDIEEGLKKAIKKWNTRIVSKMNIEDIVNE